MAGGLGKGYFFQAGGTGKGYHFRETYVKGVPKYVKRTRFFKI